MTLPIYLFGQPVLRKVAQDIPTDYPNLKELIQDMYETNTASDGVGLAVQIFFLLLQTVFLPLQVGSAFLYFLLILAAVL